MEKKEITLIRAILSIFFLSLPLAIAQNVIYGDPLPETERLSAIQVSSDAFYYDNVSYVYVKALNANNDIIDLTSLTIKPYNLTEYDDYKTTSLSQVLSKQYKQGFTIENESINNIVFKITATKGDKVITQDYEVKISEPSKSGTFQEKTIASVNFLWDGLINNWGILIIGILVLFMIIFIIKGFNYLTGK